MRYRRIQFLTKPGCGLCDEVLPLVQRASNKLGVELITIDIRDEPEMMDKYNMRIPVVLNRRGKVIAEGRITQRGAYGAALRGWF
jgi:thiol-disulfide isomerase/thioredoxin